MKKEVAEKWVEALRSGKYKQTRSQLRDLSGYCCLGVLCDISGLGNFIPSPDGSGYDFLGSLGILPGAVVSYSGIKTVNGELEGYRNLAFVNDNRGSFDQIADIIEKYWDKL